MHECNNYVREIKHKTQPKTKPLAVVYLFLIIILFLVSLLIVSFIPLTVSVCLCICPLPTCPPFSRVQEDKVSSGEACRDLWGLLFLPLICPSPRLPTGLPEILWVPESTPETSCDSSILKHKVSVCQMPKLSFLSGYEYALLNSTYHDLYI